MEDGLNKVLEELQRHQDANAATKAGYILVMDALWCLADSHESVVYAIKFVEEGDRIDGVALIGDRICAAASVFTHALPDDKSPIDSIDGVTFYEPFPRIDAEWFLPSRLEGE